MLIVKGNSNKSILANILMDKTNSICFQYYDMPVIWDSICVNKNEYSLNDFMTFIADEFDLLGKCETYYNYLIVYTNENEEDLNELIDWINKNKWRICCSDIMVMCK